MTICTQAEFGRLCGFQIYQPGLQQFNILHTDKVLVNKHVMELVNMLETGLYVYLYFLFLFIFFIVFIGPLFKKAKLHFFAKILDILAEELKN